MPPNTNETDAHATMSQVMLYGGLSYNPASKSIQASTDIYVLDFSEAIP
jgi:hypothetical protein